MNRIVRNLLVALLGWIVAFALGEVLARFIVPPATAMIYAPGRKLELILAKAPDHVPAQVSWRANSLGLRGPELPTDTSIIRILCVGGSTTECTLLNDGDTWPDVLAAELQRTGHRVWVGNAGRDGLSTFGQLELLPGLLARVRPHYVLLLNGPNDMARTAPNAQDRDLKLDPNLHPSWYGRLARRLAQHSALVRGVVLALRGHRQADSYARMHDVAFDRQQLSTHAINHLAIADSIAAHVPYVNAFRQRTDSLRAMIRASGAQPITLTQPLLAGPHGDLTAQVDGMRMAATPHHNGMTYWSILDSYNRAVCATALDPGNVGVFRTLPVQGQELIERRARGHWCIDLAQANLALEGFYDLMHANKVGAYNQGYYIAEHLDGLLTEQKLQRDQQQQRAENALYRQ